MEPGLCRGVRSLGAPPGCQPLGTVLNLSNETLRRLALAWLMIGLLLIACTAWAGVNHYGFGAPIYEGEEGPIMGQAKIRASLTGFGGVGAAFAVGAGVMLWRSRRRAERLA